MESLEEVSKSLEASTKNSLAEEESSLHENEGHANHKPAGATEAYPASKSQPLVEEPSEEKDQSVEAKDDDENENIPTPYPQLSNNPPISPEAITHTKRTDNRDEEPSVAKSFERSTSPTSALHRNKGAVVEKVGESGVLRMHKFSLYETATKYYLVGADLLDRRFRILQIDRTSEPGELDVREDDIVYSKNETNQILNAVDEAHKTSGGLKLKCSTWGLLGFTRFTGAYYMLFVTKRSQVAMIGGHYIYQVDGTELIPITTSSSTRFKSDKNPEESRFVGILNNLDLTRSFYFSYSYDITRTLQHNILREREALDEGLTVPLHLDHNDMFVWNHHLLKPAKAALKNTYDWCIPIVHGYVDQAALSVYWGRVVYITIIARRSRFFAGARYLKRGANDLGYVANDVETEQIVAEMLTTSFHAPGPALYANPNYTSYVQHRGSIPLYWTQDSTGVSPKPNIELNLVDPFYSAAALHFDNLFDRYGAPIYVLNLVKARERTPRESKLLHEYTNAVTYLNQALPKDKKIIYHAWDMSRASKSRDQDVIGSLESIGEDIIPRTSFFQNGNDAESGLKLQSGVARTNCIDCLDRTNAAQFVIAKRALGHQLQALGVIAEPTVDYDSDAVNLFTHMWHDHGDTIAIQYGGSHLVNTMATYRKINQWTSHSRDMVESFKRYYNNSFMDAQRQEAYNLFLGNYIFAQGGPMLWDLTSDYYLHHSDPRGWSERIRPSYTQWFTPEHLDKPKIPPPIWQQTLTKKSLTYFDDYWLEYYRPLAVSSFQKVFSYKMHSNLRYIPIKSTQEGKYDLSPFKVRNANERDANHSSKGQSGRKGVKIVEPPENKNGNDTSSIDARIGIPPEEVPKPQPSSLGPWLDAQQLLSSRRYTGIIKEPSFEAPSSQPQIPPIPSASSAPTPPTKVEQALEAFTRLVAQSLDPSVPDAEEYKRYLTHPLNLPLVVSTKVNAQETPSASDFIEYLDKVKQVDGLEMTERAEESREEFADFLEVGDEGLTVLEEDAPKKRYKAYRQWLRGKSLFKQRPVSGVVEV
jgi:phosphatidylinositol 3,5-bisphosphate 5-phosphatase